MAIKSNKAANSTDNRSKMGYLETLQDVQDRIDSHKLNQYDFVFVKNTRQLCIISPELEILPCRTQFDCYANESEANIAINKASYTYEGEIVMVQTELDGLKPYVVNKDGEGKFYVLAASAGHIQAITDYDLAIHTPIKNITAENEVLICDLTNGYYTVLGNYRFSEDDPTHRISTSRILFAVEHETTDDNVDVCYITEFNPYRIKFYTVSQGFFSNDKYVLESELETYIANYLDNNIDDYVDDYVDQNDATEDQINSLFSNV